MLNLIKVFRVNLLLGNKKDFIFADPLQGTLAQLVEQRTENPCVPGSIPGGTTLNSRSNPNYWFYGFFIQGV